ncbi:MAG: hypothetical protein QG593_429 [Patescibacteria group bacterium]|jgi:hypothetical protein|nr:hypothetical protein [Patescibacteria group bacterium]
MKRINAIKYGLSKTLRVHQLFVVLVLLLVILIGTVYQVIAMNNLTSEHSDMSSASSVKIIKFDEDAIERIRSLRDNNVSNPGISIPSDRRNPFNE